MMADDIVRKPRKKIATPRAPKLNRTLRSVLSFRSGEVLYGRIAAQAIVGKMSVSEVIERRMEASFDAETLEALLRRVVREEISAEREATRAVVLKRVTSFRFGDQVGFTGANPASGQAVGWPETHDDALAVMADAQH